MKKVSIIVPVYNVELHLKRCLESLVNQTLQDIEIIIINDGSKDNSQDIIDKFHSRYPDKIKYYIIENSGAAQARNYGLSLVEGEYIGFVDSDDYVEPNMFEELYSKAIEENADISVCGYYRATPEKCTERGTYPYRCFNNNVFNEPSMFINNFPYIWNKIFRASLLKENEIKFEKFRIFEDLVFTYEAFFKANKVVQVQKPLYYYRILRDNSLTNEFSEKRFDMFEAGDKLIEYFKNNNSFEYFEDELLFIILKHIYVVLEKDVKKSQLKLKNKFINKAFKYLNTRFPYWKEYNYYYKKYKKNKKRYTSKLYWRLLSLLSKEQRKAIKRNLKRTKRGIKLLKSKNLGNKFRKFLKEPIDDKSVLINSQHGKNISGNMFYILKELSKNEEYKDYKIYVAYNREYKKSFIEKLSQYKMNNAILIDINTRKYTKVLATSKFVFNDTSFPVYYIKPEGQIYLNTWHGTPLKTLGKSTTNDFYDIANLQKNFVEADYLLYPNEYMMNHMIEDYMLNGISNNKIMLCGYPRNEIFFDIDRKNEIKKKLKLEDKQLIAYMPTWRGNVRKVSVENQIKQIEEYLQYIDNNLKENQIMFVNLHPFVGNKIDLTKHTKIQLFLPEYETYDFLNICDILVTDYSSVFFDYAITKNKVILFAYDEEEYLQERGVYLKLDQLPFKKVNTVESLIEEINNPEVEDTRDFLEKFCKYDRKDISKKICENIILNKKTDIKVMDNYKKDSKNIFLYAGSLPKNDKIDELIQIINNTEIAEDYNYYISYITSRIKKNKNNLKRIANKINYMGQLNTFSNISKLDRVLLYFLNKCKKMYSIFEKRYDRIFKTELERIYAKIDIRSIIIYGKIGTNKLYTFSNFCGKKILYLNDASEFDTKLSKKAYNKYDYILVTDNKTLNVVKDYCERTTNVVKINKINSLNDIEKFSI